MVSQETPVWLPRHFQRQKDVDENGMLLQRADDENFDYKDFNFIVGKQKGG